MDRGPSAQEHSPWESSCRITGNTLSALGHIVDEVYQHLSEYDDGEVGLHSDVESRVQYLTMPDWVGRSMQDPEHTSAQLSSELRETELLALASGVQQMAKHSMRLARFKHRGFRFAHQDVRDGDQLWLLESCSLPVILRPISNNRFSFVGELHTETGRKAPWEWTWNDLETARTGELCSAGQQDDTAFQINKSKRIQLDSAPRVSRQRPIRTPATCQVRRFS
ncbi:hypothetical protein BST61_g5614 [Cercospora zeina]